MKHNEPFEDDGRTVADMSGIEHDSIWLPRRRKQGHTPAQQPQQAADRPWEEDPQLTGKDKLALAWHNIYFDLKGIAAYLCPGKATGNSDLILLIGHQIVISFFAKEFGDISGCDHNFILAFFHKRTCGLPADASDISLQGTDSGFLGIVVDQLTESCRLDHQFSFRNPVDLHLFRNQMFPCNMFLLILRIAWNFHQFHTVKKRSRDSLNIICSGNKQYLRKILGYLHIMIIELAVLLRIQHLEKGRGSISLVVAAYLIYLIEQNKRISCSCCL